MTTLWGAANEAAWAAAWASYGSVLASVQVREDSLEAVGDTSSQR